MNAGSSRLIEILMVEDNPADVRLTVEAFKDAKVLNHLNVVHDGEEALAYLRRNGKYAGVPRPDLVLLDLNLPKMDGREVLEEIKKDADLKRIPVVVLTTSNDERDILKAYDLHVNAYVTKPVALDQFVKIVEAVDDFWFSVVKLPPR
ncbi:MAG: response regulator [Deltaproteobacteria bacterium]|nr:response regulator [Deltaproteobacteria bacterium]